MGKHVIVGAGPVGRELATLLVDEGHDVVLASRSGSGVAVVGARRAAVNAADADALVTLAREADVIYNCVNPPHYHRWEREWPPIAEARLRAAETVGAVLATASNLYAYGPVDGPMVEGMADRPSEAKGRVRAAMWAEALAAHRAGRVRVVEIRASDYVGPGVGDGGHIPRVLPRALQGRTVRVFGDPNQPHTWTDVGDVARALARLAQTPEAWGRIWHAPSNPPRTQAEVIGDVCAAVGKPAVAVRAIPSPLVTALALVVPMIRELRTIDYQFRRPFIMDSGTITAQFGLEPTPWPEVCRRSAISVEK